MDAPGNRSVQKFLKTMNSDRKLYDALLDFLSSAVTDCDGHGEYERRMAAWALLEKLKNKYGGQAPPQQEEK